MKRILITLGFCLVLIGVSTSAEKILNFDAQPTPTPILTYPSTIIVEYDEEYVNQTEFIPDNAYHIPIHVGYRVWVPEWLLHSYFNLFRLLKNRYLFGAFVVFPMMINLSVENVPVWADIFPSPPNVYISIIDNEFFMQNCSILLGLYTQAPPGAFTFCLRAEAPQVHRIQGYTTFTNITITVQ